jgi:hypothetical protein
MDDAEKLRVDRLDQVSAVDDPVLRMSGDAELGAAGGELLVWEDEPQRPQQIAQIGQTPLSYALKTIQALPPIATNSVKVWQQTGLRVS